ncbi:hypothetical protein BC828DRAFT_372886 [Blastocladiella britannica]|nr:hypothetical protein BC828DRAFT_372886 [Blastocladiella britannica]
MADARTLLRAAHAQKQQQKLPPGITDPFAVLDAPSGKLRCERCLVLVKPAAASWRLHTRSPEHLRALKATPVPAAPSVPTKRSMPDPSSTATGPSPKRARLAPNSKPSLVSYADSDSDSDSDSALTTGPERAPPQPVLLVESNNGNHANEEEDEDDDQALPAGFFDDDQDNPSSSDDDDSAASDNGDAELDAFLHSVAAPPPITSSIGGTPEGPPGASDAELELLARQELDEARGGRALARDALRIAQLAALDDLAVPNGTVVPANGTIVPSDVSGTAAWANQRRDSDTLLSSRVQRLRQAAEATTSASSGEVPVAVPMSDDDDEEDEEGFASFVPPPIVPPLPLSNANQGNVSSSDDDDEDEWDSWRTRRA